MANPKDAAADPAAANIRAILDLERQAAREASFGERIGGRISNLIGSMAFVTVQSVAMLVWIVWNELAPAWLRFDPYPYGLLTFIVSLEGVLIATFVLIAQNRMSRQTDQRDHLNLQIDLLAEQEMTLMLKMLRRVSERLGVGAADGDEARAERLAEGTNVYELVRTLRRELPENDRS
jgi:uncharacterized membrane protein